MSLKLRDSKATRKETSTLTEKPIGEIKAHLNAFLKEAEDGPVIVTRHGTPAGVIIGFKDADDFLEWRLVNDPAIRERVRRANAQIEANETHSLREAKKMLDIAD